MFDGNIKTKSGFQSSVNIAFDLHDSKKIKGFIPTAGVLPFMEELVLSTSRDATSRARVLIGAYGRGKSHLVLTTLALLHKKDETLFTTLFDKLKKENPPFYAYVKAYVKSEDRLLPVVVQGSSANLTQSLLFALKQSLTANELDDLMPESNFQSVVDTIHLWEADYPDTYQSFSSRISTDIPTFIADLKEYNVGRYEEFLEIFPELTAGSEFNPFANTDVVELYEEVAKKLKKHGYNGIFVVYDEFSKYLESSIAQTSSNEVKMLQDFAEKCDRSGENQLHLLLISHKSLTNYIEQNLPKNKLDGWMGVSGRFSHHYLLGDYAQMYEMVATVIEKKEPFWTVFEKENETKFTELSTLSVKYKHFQEELQPFYKSCYPLHPATLFLLPRLAEKIAQNERTLFTFLSNNRKHTLYSFLKGEDATFPLMTPDYLYDYFEPLLKKEVYTTTTHQVYLATQKALSKLTKSSYEAKILKTIAIIYIVEQFELLSPDMESIVYIYGQSELGFRGVESLLTQMLQQSKYLYCKQSDGLLKIKQPNSVDITKELADAIGKNYGTINVTEVLNQFINEDYWYPTAYNEDMELIRYFKFRFLQSKDLDTLDFEKDREENSVGSIYAIIPKSTEELDSLPEKLSTISASAQRVLFCLPKKHKEMKEQVASYAVIQELKTKFWDDEDSLAELDMRYEDLLDILTQFVEQYKNPELGAAQYFHNGTAFLLKRKSHISGLLSDICHETFVSTPIINNETIVKDIITGTARNSRNKVVSGLLEKELQTNLGLTGTGQDISFMRSTLVYTKILQEGDDYPYLNLSPPDNNLAGLLTEIDCFFSSPEAETGVCFQDLYDKLTLPQYGYGIKKGLIPVYLAVVLHTKQKYLLLKTNDQEVAFTCDSLNNIAEAPHKFTVTLDHYDREQENYLRNLKELFSPYSQSQSRGNSNIFQEIMTSMLRWYAQLPQYTKSVNFVYKGSHGEPVPLIQEQLSFMGYLKKTEKNSRDYIQNEMPKLFHCEEDKDALLKKISNCKSTFDGLQPALLKYLTADVKILFAPKHKKAESLSSIIKNYTESLKESTHSHLFPQGEERLLKLLREVTHDEEVFMEKLAKVCTGLRTADWNAEKISIFFSYLKNAVETINKYNQEDASGFAEEAVANGYQLSFFTNDGVSKTKSFEKLPQTQKGNLLYAEIETALGEMGDAITVGEKRQILMSHLEKLC